MSKFGFKELERGILTAEKQFLHEGMQIAKKSFDSNFEKQADPGDEEGYGGQWDELKYRKEPPPILQLTGALRRASTENGNTVYGGNFAIFTIDPVDKKGRGYAAYHDTGTSKMAQRRSIAQPKELDFEQMNALKNIVDKVFNKQGLFS